MSFSLRVDFFSKHVYLFIMTREKPQSDGPHLILYDGVCGLCNRLNSFVLSHDKKDQFRFASLQSATGQALLQRIGKDPNLLDTLYVLPSYQSGSGTALERARAALFILRALGTPWRWAGIFGVLPDSFLDFAYDCIAHNRYRIFGKYDQCRMPRSEDRKRFIDV
jgi:predicted DCC family thiol-disulfide oxidoreductase YuxK